jgi:gamma-glutamylcyclotransferase (GGCT)/AIG2-like uncharacterized protein YtfP
MESDISATTVSLFVYGTLLREPVQRALFHAVPTQRSAVVFDYEAVPYKDFNSQFLVAVPSAGSILQGKVLTVQGGWLPWLDGYESTAYRRIYPVLAWTNLGLFRSWMYVRNL